VRLVGSTVWLKWTLEIRWKSVDWIYLAQDSDNWRAATNVAMDLRTLMQPFLTRGQWTPKKSVYRFQGVRELGWEEITILFSLSLN
jgi:hypothetical protein